MEERASRRRKIIHHNNVNNECPRTISAVKKPLKEGITFTTIWQGNYLVGIAPVEL